MRIGGLAHGGFILLQNAVVNIVKFSDRITSLSLCLNIISDLVSDGMEVHQRITGS